MHEDTTVGCKFATQLNCCIFQNGVGHGHIHEPCHPAYDYVVWSERPDFPSILPDFSRGKNPANWRGKSGKLTHARREAHYKFLRRRNWEMGSSGVECMEDLQKIVVQWGAGSTLALGFQILDLANDANSKQQQLMHHTMFGNILLLQTMLIQRKLGQECYL